MSSFFSRLTIVALSPLLTLLTSRYSTFVWFLRRCSPAFLDQVSRARAWRVFHFAKNHVPAYHDFLQGAVVRDWESIPATDKEQYVKKYSVESRCVGGALPSVGVAIDESSGSTGTPYNWVRTVRERQESHVSISYFATFCFGQEPWITINAFSMGAWATGVNMGIALQKNSIVKNTGPDLAKILHTLTFFGPKYPYLITGYPPFLKQLYDQALAQGFPWSEYRISALVGGEGMSEGLRDYLIPGYQKVYSGYGATDLEIGIAGETPVSVAIRQLARKDEQVRRALFGTDSRLPMIFQYNPLMHYVEVNEQNELLFTITRTSLLSPRVKYNIHDEGGVMRYDVLEQKLQELGYSLSSLIPEGEALPLSLPFVWVYGRKDFTISIMGANIYPEDIEQCVYADRELAKITRSFCQSTLEGDGASVLPLFSFEVTAPITDVLREQFAASIVKTLLELNADFRAAWEEYPDTLQPEIRLYGIGEGPFVADAGKIKQTRRV